MSTDPEHLIHPLKIVRGKNRPLDGIKKILVVQLGDIGDVVLAGPFFESLKKHFPAAELTVAVRDKAHELVDLCPWVNRSISVAKNDRSLLKAVPHYFRFFHELRAVKFDLAIDMRTGTRGGVLAYLSGAPLRMGFHALDNKWRNGLFTHLAYPPMADMPDLHQAHYSLFLLKTFEIPICPHWPRLVIEPQLQHRVRRRLSERRVPLEAPVIAVQPFSLWRYKEWGEDKFARLIVAMQQRFDISVLLCGNTSERPRAEAMLASCGEKRVFNMAGLTSIGEYAALLAQCDLMIGCDSAGVHIAAAVGTPTASIFGPTAPGAWAPRSAGHLVIRQGCDRMPCKRLGCDDSGVSQCLQSLSVARVFGELEPILMRIATDK